MKSAKHGTGPAEDIIMPPSRAHDKKIISSIEKLATLFILPDDHGKFLKCVESVLGMIDDYVHNPENIFSSITIDDLADLFSDTEPPTDPRAIEDVLHEIREKVISYSVKVGSPYYIGHMTSSIPYFLILIEMIIAILNQNQVKIETAKASTFLEREFLSWVHRGVFRLPRKFYQRTIQDHARALGNITVDGTQANITALWVAREKAFPPDKNFQGVRKEGIQAALRHYGYSSAAVLVSKLGHYSFDKAMDLLGLGSKNLIRVPVNQDNQIDIKKLRRKIAGLNKGSGRCRIIALVGIAGTTETGNIDDLKMLRDVADECGAHYHVDAAWGGATLITKRYRHLLAGVELADSVTIDAHKLFYNPMSMGMVLFRNKKDLSLVKYTTRYVVRHGSIDQGRFTIEGSRPFDALKPWASLKIMGTKGYQVLFDHAFTLSSDMHQIVSASKNFEPMNTPQLFIHVYRFVPAPVQSRLRCLLGRHADRDTRSRARKAVRTINAILNDLNVDLHRAIRQEDSTFVSRTTLEASMYSPQRIVVLRSVTVNPLTTRAMLQEILRKQDKTGMSIYEKKYKHSMAPLLR